MKPFRPTLPFSWRSAFPIVFMLAAVGVALTYTLSTPDPIAQETTRLENLIASGSIRLTPRTAGLANYNGSGFLGNYTGSSSTACGAGSAVSAVSFDASGNVSVTCVAAGGIAATQLEAGWYGLGGDGAVTFDGTTTVTINGIAIVPSGSAYTLPTDIEATNLAVNAGVTVNEAGYHVWGTGTCTINGSFQDNGSAGANGTGTLPGAGGAARAAGFYPATSPGIAGGNNSTTASDLGSVPRGVGIASIASSTSGGGAGGAAFSGGAGGIGPNGGSKCQGGAAGGGGGATIAAAGGQDSSGAALTLTAANRGDTEITQFLRGFFLYPTNTITALGLGGTGGGGGAVGGGGTATGGGGGGAGGGFVNLWCRNLAGSGTFGAIGGAGGNGATDPGAGRGATGGGGGGGGGEILLVYSHNTGTWTTNVLGGARGSGGIGSGGGGNGGSGGLGSSCVYIPLNISGDGT